MTDTPDALIKKYQEAVFAFVRDQDHMIGPAFDAMAVHGEAIRARIEAGDAAIKRVAQLNQTIRDDMAVVQDACRREAAALADLAAARAEIERLTGALAWIKEIGVRSGDLLAQITDAVDIAATALAPKETNNG